MCPTGRLALILCSEPYVARCVQRGIAPPSDSYFVYGYQSRHPGGAAIGR
jgi:hypothetical protein